jgi:hypothetical protein
MNSRWKTHWHYKNGIKIENCLRTTRGDRKEHDVRYWPKADMATALSDVRFWG